MLIKFFICMKNKIFSFKFFKISKNSQNKRKKTKQKYSKKKIS